MAEQEREQRRHLAKIALAQVRDLLGEVFDVDVFPFTQAAQGGGLILGPGEEVLFVADEDGGERVIERLGSRQEASNLPRAPQVDAGGVSSREGRATEATLETVTALVRDLW